LFKRVFQKVIHFYNVPRLPDFFSTIAVSKEDEFISILHHLWAKKKSYWLGHYSQRKAQLTAKALEQPKLDRKVKGKLIRYQWLVKWIPAYTIEVTAELEMWPLVLDADAKRLLNETVESFSRKRANVPDPPLVTEKPKAFLQRIDAELKPVFSFLKLYENVHSTMKEMSRDIAKVFKNLTEPSEAFSTDDPLGYMWRNSLADAISDEAEWEEYLDQAGSDEDWLRVLDVDDPYMLSRMPKERLVEEIAKTSLFSSVPTTLSTKSTLVQTSIILSKKEGKEKNRDFDLPPPTIEQTDIDLSERPKEHVKESLQALKALGGKSVFSMKSFSMKAPPVKANRSPIAELEDKHGTLPNLLAWANAASVDVAKLNQCSVSEFAAIYEAGKNLLAKGKESLGEESYDVL
jgi:hypothetical protein